MIFLRILANANETGFAQKITYCKRGNIHWAKYSRFQPYEVFCGNTFAVPWPAVFVIYVFTGKLMILLKTVKTAKV